MSKTKKTPQSKTKLAKPGKRPPKIKLAPKKPAFVIGRLDGKFKVTGDIVSPVVPAEDWEYD